MAHSAEHTVQASSDEAVHHDHFVKVFIGVLVALTVFTLLCMAIARALAPPEDPATDSILRAQLVKRIAPVGVVATSEDQLDAPVTTVAADSTPQTGPELVAANCAACHQAGVAGAPRSDDAAEWGKRREAGLDALVASVINGKGNMAARAGTTLTDDQIRLAVQHLAGFENEETSAAPDTSATAVAETASVGAVAATEGLTDQVKGVADSVCTACHLSGVGGAPKLGDKEAWAERAEKGLEGMIGVVAKGQGAMPPRGGSALTDDEIGVAIEYLMSK